mgnify:CR=1 FL=1
MPLGAPREHVPAQRVLGLDEPAERVPLPGLAERDDVEIVGVELVDELGDRVEAEALAQVVAEANRPASVHLKVDTGLSRNGSSIEEWPALVAATVDLVGQGLVETVGVFSHLSSTSETDDRAQIAAFDAAVEQARALGL